MQIKPAVKKLAELGYTQAALTDVMSVSAMVPFGDACRDNEIKPVIGCTLRVYRDPTYRKPAKASGEVELPNPNYRLKVYVKSDAGMKSLMKLLSKANSAEYFYYHSRCGLEDVMQLEDVIVTSGDLFGLFHMENHIEILQRLATKFQTYVEINPIHTPLYDTLNSRALVAAEVTGLPLVASYPAFYVEQDGADTLDVARAIVGNNKMTDPWLPIPYVRDWAIHEPATLVRKLGAMAGRIGMSRDQIKESINNGISILNACEYTFKKLEPSLPKMAEDEFAKLVEECKLGWMRRFAKPVLGHRPSDDQLPVYKERLAYELGVLKKLGFAGYFLLTQNIVQWAKANGIAVGPGRGSVGGSLVAYLIGITDVDPIRFNLLFERFINPDRLDLPDADLDFASSRRQDVIAYIVDHFGADKVAGISNYSTLGAAGSLRDVSRVHDLPPLEYACSKQVEKEHGVSQSLEDSLIVPDIASFAERHPGIWKHATGIEGCMRSLGQHAAGVVVAGEPITNRAPVETRAGKDMPVVSWDKRVVEDWGLIKMDILGLSTLDVLSLARCYIKERHGIDLDLLSVPLDEPDVMKAFGEGKTTGIFQFESGGMKKLLMNLAATAPLTFEEITATTALYRPGPLDAGMTDQFVAVKNGDRAVHYEHPAMQAALESTYGVLCYQEQIMQVCRDLSGFTMAEADAVRKAMGKKDHDKMAKMKDKFVAGAVAAGMDEMTADLLWEKIAGFASYAFNRSHAAEYSVISYWAMWLKVRYPSEFYAAAMTVEVDEDKLKLLVSDAQNSGLRVLPPDINKSSDRIEIGSDGALYAPFQAIKGISEKVANYIVTAKEKWGKPFTSEEDFIAALKYAEIGGKVNVRHRENLMRVGAFAEATGDKFPAMHPERLRDRLELMPGFTVDAVKASRDIPRDKIIFAMLRGVVNEFKECSACSLAGEPHPVPRIGSKAKFMVVFDSPNWKEGKKNKLLADESEEGSAGSVVKAALADAGLDLQDGYFTCLVKSVKKKDQKGLTTEQINGCTEHLKRELEILKPPVILTMGREAARFFAPSLKVSASELAGKVIYDPVRDASIVFGVSPGTIYHNPGALTSLQAAVAKVAELVE